MASHESDMHRRLRHALGEIERLEQENEHLRSATRSLAQRVVELQRYVNLLLFRLPPPGQLETTEKGFGS